jgi:hypothetical protein
LSAIEPIGWVDADWLFIREMHQYNRLKECLSFPVFPARLGLKLIRSLMRFFGFVETMAEEGENPLLNDLSRSQIRYDLSWLQGYLTLGLISMNILS